MSESVVDALRGLPPALVVFVAAMLPVSELRGAIPAGLLIYDLPVGVVLALALVGNFLPVPFIVYALEPVSDWMRARSRLADRFFNWLFERTRRKHTKRFERFEELALISFVAIPLPLTGAWTGALAGFLFGVPQRRSMPLIAVGILIAATIVTTLVLTGAMVFGQTQP